MAEWSKAVRSGRILSWQGFESLRCHFVATYFDPNYSKDTQSGV